MSLFLDISSESSTSHEEIVSVLNCSSQTNNGKISLFSKSTLRKSFAVGLVLCILIGACYSFSQGSPEVRVKVSENLSSNFSETHAATSKYNREDAWVYDCHKYCCQIRGGGWFDKGDTSCHYYLCCQGERNN